MTVKLALGATEAELLCVRGLLGLHSRYYVNQSYNNKTISTEQNQQKKIKQVKNEANL